MGYGKNVLEYLDDAAARVPDKTAVQEEQQQLTFLQLQRLSRRIGTAVARLVQAVRRPVAVLCDRQALAFAGLLGVLQSGNCYVPLEARMPQQRLEAILNQLQPAALLYLKQDEAAALPCAAARCGPGLSHLHLRLHRHAQGNRHLPPGAHRLHRVDRAEL